MRSLEIDVGAASFEASNLGNANASLVHVQGGVGSVDLDFGGQWSQDMTVDADLAFGKLTLHVPRDVGVRVEVQKFLASFDQQGLGSVATLTTAITGIARSIIFASTRKRPSAASSSIASTTEPL